MGNLFTIIYVINLCFNPLSISQIRLYMKAFRALAVFDYFFTRHWTFICSNKFKLWGKLSDCDRHTFYFNVKDIDWPNYFETYVLGTRQYIFKESLEAVPEAKKKFKR